MHTYIILRVSSAYFFYCTTLLSGVYVVMMSFPTNHTYFDGICEHFPQTNTWVKTEPIHINSGRQMFPNTKKILTNTFRLCWSVLQCSRRVDKCDVVVVRCSNEKFGIWKKCLLIEIKCKPNLLCVYGTIFFLLRLLY